MARLRALMRRDGMSAVRDDARLTVGDLLLDEDSHEVRRAGDARPAREASGSHLAWAPIMWGE